MSIDFYVYVGPYIECIIPDHPSVRSNRICPDGCDLGPFATWDKLLWGVVSYYN